MNAKELRQAAEYIVTMWDNHDSKRIVAGDELFFNSDGEPDSVTFARHILSTVREDDDEPVTEEWLETFCERKTARAFAVKFLEVFARTKDVWLCNPATGERYALIKTRGQFRSLCRGLGVELKEVSRVD